MNTARDQIKRPPPLTVTEAAIAQMKHLIALHQPGAAGIRLSVREGGCNGKSYSMDFTDDKDPMDEELALDGVNLFVDPMSIMYLIGTEMDFVDEKIGANFVFRNPNETGRCGCGESFSV
jgi:iron-sulfur cluster assembly protein